MELKNNELRKIAGGAFTSALINAITKAATFIFDLGKYTGSTIRRLTSGSYCPTN